VPTISAPSVPHPLEPELLTVTEIARACGVSSQTVRNWVRSGLYGLPRPVALGSRTLRFRAAEVRAWLARLGQGTAHAS
jgi:excisionase family DNA binding protein